MKSKIFLFLCILTIMSGVLIYGTYANYVTSSRTTNIITTNEVKIELIEKTYAQEGILVDFNNKVTHKVKPGDSFSKIPYVQNIGSEPCYVRMNISTQYDEHLVLDLNKNWIQEEKNENTINGWYKYNKILEVGETTEPIFTTVTFSLMMGNEFMDEEITVNLMADAVQSEHNDEFLINLDDKTEKNIEESEEY